MLKDKCKMSKYLAYFMLIYCISCVYYMVFTRNIGTPFNDTLTPAQLKIKQESASIRSNIFKQGIIVGIIFIIIHEPFKVCN